MPEMARVKDITHTTKHDEENTPHDVVCLVWGGKVYFWGAKPGEYTVGQVVPIDPPAKLGDNITPA